MVTQWMTPSVFLGLQWFTRMAISCQKLCVLFRVQMALSSQRISKIMKGVMSLAGIDTTVFKGGSGRHAASPAAAHNKVPFE